MKLLTAFMLIICYDMTNGKSIHDQKDNSLSYINRDVKIPLNVGVVSLVVGNMTRSLQYTKMTGSVTLIKDNGYYLVVDSPSATDLVGKETMLEMLAKQNISPGIVNMAIATHGHPDHTGQANFFSNARHFFASYEYTDNTYVTTELLYNDSMKLTNNVELWNTPGHTNQDLTVMVRTSCCGSVAVVGDLFYDESDAVGNIIEWTNDAWNAQIGMVSRRKVICNAQVIVPGHGPIFRVTKEMRSNYNCDKCVKCILINTRCNLCVPIYLKPTQTTKEVPTTKEMSTTKEILTTKTSPTIQATIPVTPSTTATTSTSTTTPTTIPTSSTAIPTFTIPVASKITTIFPNFDDIFTTQISSSTKQFMPSTVAPTPTILTTQNSITSIFTTEASTVLITNPATTRTLPTEITVKSISTTENITSSSPDDSRTHSTTTTEFMPAIKNAAVGLMGYFNKRISKSGNVENAAKDIVDEALATIKKFVIKEESANKLNEFSDQWLNNKFEKYMTYYIFNYTNTLEIVTRGSLPDVTEKGPYSYKETWIHYNQSFSQNKKLFSFSRKKVFVFDPKTSCSTCLESDQFIVPDLTFMILYDNLDAENICDKLPAKIKPFICGATNKVKEDIDIGSLIDQIRNLLANGMKAFGVGPFVKVTAGDLLFKGYQDPIFTKMFKNILTIVETVVPGIKSFLNGIDITIPPIAVNQVNNTMGLIYTVRTGIDEQSKVGQTYSFIDQSGNITSDGNRVPQAWWPFDGKMKSCLRLDNNRARDMLGTNADFFKAQIKKTDTIYAYVEDICRSIKFAYSRETSVKGIDTYRFFATDDNFNYDNEQNCGFCSPLDGNYYEHKKGSYCMPKGLSDMSRCIANNPPLAVSNPHFHGSEESVIRLFPRFNPVDEVDQTTLDVEPTTGTVLRANQKMQINVMMKQYSNISVFSIIPPGAYPLVHLNQTFLTDMGTVNSLNNQLFDPKNLATILSWTVGVGLGAVLMVLSIISCLVVSCYRSSDMKKED
uniref:Lactamase_B domain-containing protein n=1 Tax=Rhabditophanes sp. KR3021 TaxID=114890 RepID=A0AC35UIM2_9BILA